jgi:hypothetical protein
MGIMQLFVGPHLAPILPASLFIAISLFSTVRFLLVFTTYHQLISFLGTCDNRQKKYNKPTPQHLVYEKSPNFPKKVNMGP